MTINKFINECLIIPVAQFVFSSLAETTTTEKNKANSVTATRIPPASPEEVNFCLFTFHLFFSCRCTKYDWAVNISFRTRYWIRLSPIRGTVILRWLTLKNYSLFVTVGCWIFGCSTTEIPFSHYLTLEGYLISEWTVNIKVHWTADGWLNLWPSRFVITQLKDHQTQVVLMIEWRMVVASHSIGVLLIIF